jgi:hypothetical protein
MNRWEYKTIEIPVEWNWRGEKRDDANALSRELNALGEQGWELVNAFDLNIGHGASRFVVALLKRPASA